MTRAEINAEIATACGWKLIDDKTYGRAPYVTESEYQEFGNNSIPNYYEDLNAMHEAEKVLKDDHTSQDFQHARYVNHLENIVSSKNHGWSFSLLNSAAPQRAEAFLRTFGKWEQVTALQS